MSEISSNLKLIEDAITRNDIKGVSSLLDTIKKETKPEDIPSIKKTLLNLAYKSIIYGSYPVFEFFLEQDKTILTTPINGSGNYLIQNVATIGTFDAFKEIVKHYKKEKVNLADLLNSHDWNILHTIVNIEVSSKDLPKAAEEARARINQMLDLVKSIDPSVFFKMWEKENKLHKKPFQICKEESTYSYVIHIVKESSKKFDVGAELLSEVKKFEDLQDSFRKKMLQRPFSTQDTNKNQPTKIK